MKTLLKKGIGAVLGGEGNNKGPLFLRAFHALPQQDSSKKSSMCIYDQQYSRNHLAGAQGAWGLGVEMRGHAYLRDQSLENTLDA